MYKRFESSKDISYLREFTPEEMLLVYLQAVARGDADLIYLFTYNGGKLPAADTFRQQYYDELSNKELESSLKMRYYDSVTAQQDAATEAERTVVISASIGLYTSQIAYGLKQEQGIWKMDIYHLIEHAKQP
ncbi:hypothetical protein B9T62_04325 [Paenibacillus donghaensis]|uniref:Uncharacterized protein n=1 Tax=Paenibacillus donghaensis TaxID=414771 RepID=A0A2Z2K600_9BACL|nr:hypothetical protein B9T62_04325 [Paenibacillus donghaensis]